MLLSFQKRFVEPILSGQKIHTLRADPGSRWKKGMKIHGATGVRSKQYNQFFASECSGVQPIFLSVSQNSDGSKFGLCMVISDTNKLLSREEQIAFAKRDGFESVEEFVEVLRSIYGRSKKNFKLDMKIIHWTDFRY